MAHASIAPAAQEPLTLRWVVGRALVTYRDRFTRVVGMALIVFFPLGILGTIGDRISERYEDNVPGPFLALILAIGGVAVLTTMLGSAFYAGLLDKLVGAHQHGHREMTIWEVLRQLPYANLLLADVLLTLGTGVSIVFLLIPGLVFFTFFSLVGPLINIERHHAIKAFGRSAQLVRRRFWLVFFAVTVPTAIEVVVHDQLHEVLHHQNPLLAAFIGNALVMATFGALVGLMEVTLTYELSTLDPPKSATPAE